MKSRPDISFWHPLGFLSRNFHLDFEPFEKELERHRIDIGGEISAHLLVWDSEFFNSQIIKIGYLSESPFSKIDLLNALNISCSQSWNIFAELPSEAIRQIQLLSKSGFTLIETRLNYYHSLERVPEDPRKSRFALVADIEPLRYVASNAVNDFDKYHADPFFSPDSTNQYLETYIENCVRGFAEKVFVPDIPNPPASFVALSRVNDPAWKELNPIFRIPLTACLPENQGWHYPLCIAAMNYARTQNGRCIVMTTQSTNRAVIHNCEKLGFKLGSCTHIFSLSKQ